MKKIAFLAATLAAAGSTLVIPTVSVTAAKSELNPKVEMPAKGRQSNGVPVQAQARVTVSKTSNGINYNNGPVMTSPNGVNAYVIWYGTWTTTQKSIVTDFFSNVGGSPYYNINTTYYDKTGAKIANKVTLANQIDDAYSVGSSNLSDANIQTVVFNAITSGALPSDANGVYFVLTSADVTKSGFLTNYCGWHTYTTISGANIKYSFVGNPGTSSACAAQTTSSPNGDVGVDAAISVIAHELVEAASDPNLNAWYDSRGYENADKCAWTFGTTYTVGNGSKANMKLGSRDFLIQRNWLNANGGLCTLKY